MPKYGKSFKRSYVWIFQVGRRLLTRLGSTSDMGCLRPRQRVEDCYGGQSTRGWSNVSGELAFFVKLTMRAYDFQIPWQPLSCWDEIIVSTSIHLLTCMYRFYPRWKDWELRQAMDLHYTIDDAQLSEDWSEILSLASKPGASLEQVHVFCLAHVLRRPIIVYGVKYVKSWRGENLGFARFEGEYPNYICPACLISKHDRKMGYDTKLHISGIFGGPVCFAYLYLIENYTAAVTA